MEHARVVIVGGGVIGCSVAYQLAKRGCRDVLVLEREKLLGACSTSKAVGGIRAQFSSRINIRLSQLSLPVFETFDRDFEWPIDFRQFGYLWLVSRAEQWGAFQKAAEMQRAEGVPVETLTPEQARKLAPIVRSDDLVGANFCAKDGFVDPNGVVQGFAKQARKLGVRIREGVTVTGMKVEEGRVNGVETTDGPVATEMLVCCAGAWSAELGKLGGVEIPIRPFRRQYFVTAPIPKAPDRLPFLIDTATGVYLKLESGGLLFSKIDHDEPSSFNTTPDWGFVEKIVEDAVHRVPVLEEAEVVTGVAGLYEETPDHHPIIDKAESPKGFYVVAGFSGHGIMHSPAAGILVAELILENRTSIDISPLSLSRFAKGGLVDETNVI